MKNIKYVIPNLLTIFNLMAGCVSIIIVFRGENEFMAAWLIFIAAVFDFLDGLAARALDAKSEFGVQLDSLADVVSFGVAPSIILFNWFTLILTDISAQSTFEIISANFWQSMLLFSSLLFVAGGALRLARFNTEGKSEGGFQGLPIPAAALIVASLWLILGTTESEAIHRFLLNIYMVLGLILILVFLMVSRIEMLSLKFNGLGFTDNYYQYLILIMGAVLFVLFSIQGFFFAMLAYIIISLFKALIDSNKK
jgi:CDP-diacylglycerol---serine O-phosphatidyltransferase